MANEVTVNVSLQYADSEGTNKKLDVAGFIASVSLKIVAELKQNVGTSAVAMQLGGVAALGWVLLVNRDTSNYVSLLPSSNGIEVDRLPANNGAKLGYFGSGMQTPWLKANTAACQVEIFILSQ